MTTPPPPGSSPIRPLAYRVRKRATDLMNALLVRWFPTIYNGYMWFVYKTSRVEHVNTDLLWRLRERYGGLVGIMWHQDVVTVAWSFRQYEGQAYHNQPRT